MNLAPLPDRTVADVQALIEKELGNIQDPDLLRGLRSFLIEPRIEMRTWDWGKRFQQYPVWVVAESSVYDYGIAFSDYGFAPEHPWGLIFLSQMNFDADYCWLSSLEAAYRDSRLIEEFNDSKHVID